MVTSVIDKLAQHPQVSNTAARNIAGVGLRGAALTQIHSSFTSQMNLRLLDKLPNIDFTSGGGFDSFRVHPGSHHELRQNFETSTSQESDLYGSGLGEAIPNELSDPASSLVLDLLSRELNEISDSLMISTGELQFRELISEDLERLRLLDQDWDGNNSLAPTDYSLEKTKSFLQVGSTLLSGVAQDISFVPSLGVGPEGSVDVHWITGSRELLVNIPASDEDVVKYYGDTGDGREPFRGEFNADSSCYWVYFWLLGI